MTNGMIDTAFMNLSRYYLSIFLTLS